MQAPKIETQTLPPPPGIIGSLRAGFDVTTANIYAILLPVLLDLFLWLGPHFSVDTLAQPFVKYLQDGLNSNPAYKTPDAMAQMQLFLTAVKEYNLFTVLRTFPIGIPSLMSGKLSGLPPVGPQFPYQVNSYFGFAIGFFMCTLVGWVFGGFYFRAIAGLVSPEAQPGIGRTIFQTLLYSVIWVVVCWILGIPLLVTLALIFTINNTLGFVVLVILAFISMWLIVPVFFSPHGIFLKKQNAFASILSSFQLARFTLPTSSLFIMTVFMLSFASNLLWKVPENDSWFTLVGILGHGFITTALLASTFVYYQDMTGWLQTVLARLRSGMPTG